jgi:signal transduction histidine kinase
MVQLVSNLVANAIQHGRDPIVVEAKDRGDAVVLEVRNAGELEPSVVQRLFEPFVSSRGSKRRGLGLGLYIVREVAKAHGGRVEAESAPGETIFRVEIPREQAESTEIRVRVPKARASNRGGTGRSQM